VAKPIDGLPKIRSLHQFFGRERIKQRLSP
jgi:hypothetical protein